MHTSTASAAPPASRPVRRCAPSTFLLTDLLVLLHLGFTLPESILETERKRLPETLYCRVRVRVVCTSSCFDAAVCVL
jgi:hypothetical protein